MTEDDFKIALEAHRLRNESLLSELRARGVDLQKPRPVELNFWAPNQQHAALLAKNLYDKGYLVLVLAPANRPEPERQWNLEVGANLTVVRVISGELTRELIELASQQSSEYDGWGTSV